MDPCKCGKTHCGELDCGQVRLKAMPKSLIFHEVSLQSAMHQFDWNEITKRVFLKVGNAYSRITHFRPAGKGAVVSHSLGYGYSMMSLGDSVFVEMDSSEPGA